MRTLVARAGGSATAVDEDGRDAFLYDRIEALGTDPVTAATTLVDLHHDFLREADREGARLCLRLAVETAVHGRPDLARLPCRARRRRPRRHRQR